MDTDHNSTRTCTPYLPQVGTWCPWAEVLCPGCHNASDRRRFDVPAEVHTPVDGQDVCPCSRCGRPVMVWQELAWLRNLQASLAAAGVASELDQPGGMTSALFVRVDGGCGDVFGALEDADPSTAPMPFLYATSEDGYHVGVYRSAADWYRSAAAAPFPAPLVETADDERTPPALTADLVQRICLTVDRLGDGLPVACVPVAEYRIRLYRADGRWMAHHTDPKVQALFGTSDLATPFDADTPAGTVANTVQRNNPHAVVVVA